GVDETGPVGAAATDDVARAPMASTVAPAADALRAQRRGLDDTDSPPGWSSKTTRRHVRPALLKGLLRSAASVCGRLRGLGTPPPADRTPVDYVVSTTSI